MEGVHLRDTSGEFTEVLNAWVINNDLKSANQLRSIVYYHLKGMVKKQISKKAESDNALSLLDKLPNTTSLLHDVIIKLTAPDEIFENRQQFYASLAVFVRWMLQDEIKKRSAKKRTNELEDVVQITNASIDSGLYLSFDNALSSLENVSKRCYQIALLHYYLGQNVGEITSQLNLSESTVYNELSAAKAYLRVQCEAA